MARRPLEQQAYELRQLLESTWPFDTEEMRDECRATVAVFDELLYMLRANDRRDNFKKAALRDAFTAAADNMRRVLRARDKRESL